MKVLMAALPDPSNTSGRASPANPNHRQDEEGASKKDKAVRRWGIAIERALATYHGVAEWADYIAFLGRLLKVLQSRPSGFDDVCHKKLMAKRLAQCLGPSLPSGVHQKTIEVYRYIFSILDPIRLSQDLRLYLPGLAPAISFASLSVKPLLLELYESFIVELDPSALRPALKSLILSLLPALEEETADEFDRATGILLKLRVVSQNSSQQPNDQFFWECLYLASITNPSRRPGALAFLARNLPGPASTTGPEHVDGDRHISEQKLVAVPFFVDQEPGLLIRCFCTGLLDTHVLVQRGFLDLLCDKLPLHSPALRVNASKEDLRSLVMAALSVVLRRDMSLNRRLWTWFLGTTAQTIEPADSSKSPLSSTAGAIKTPTTAEHSLNQVDYCKKYTLPLIVYGVCEQMKGCEQSASTIVQSLRICIALMDRWEIGNAVIPFIFRPVILRVSQFYSSSATKASRNEVLRSASMFFDSVESLVIWREAFVWMDKSFSTEEEMSKIESLEVMIFVLTKFNLREEDMQDYHIPLAATYTMLRLLSRLYALSSKETASDSSLHSSFRMLLALLHLVPNGRLSTSASNEQCESLDAKKCDEIAQDLGKTYLGSQAQHIKKQKNSVLGRRLLQAACETMATVLRKYHYCRYETVELAVATLDLTLRKVPSVTLDPTSLLEELQYRSTAGDVKPDERPYDFPATLVRISVLEVLQSSKQGIKLLKEKFLRATVPDLVASAWRALTPVDPRHHVEGSKAIWRLHSVCDGSDLVESCIVELDTNLTATSKLHATSLSYSQSFTIFWQQSQGQPDMAKHRRLQVTKIQNTLTTSKLQLLSRPLFHILDKLLGPEDEASIFVAHWLEQLPELLTILNVVLAHTVRATASLAEPSIAGLGLRQDLVNDELPDLDNCIYFIQLLTKVLMLGRLSLQAAIRDIVTDDQRQQLLTRLEIIVDTCVRVQTYHQNTINEEESRCLVLKKTALALLDLTLPLLPMESITRLSVDIDLLGELEVCIAQKDHILQLALTQAVTDALELRWNAEKVLSQQDASAEARETGDIPDRVSVARDRNAPEQKFHNDFTVPSQVIECIIRVFSSDSMSPVIDCWYHFMQRIMPMYGSGIFKILLPLNECFCMVLSSMMHGMKETFSTSGTSQPSISETAIIQVLNALERSLEMAHGILTEIATSGLNSKQEQQPASFFGMVSALSSETSKNKGSTDTQNNTLTVTLCFKDALRVCFDIWALDEASIEHTSQESTSLASFKYTVLRLRNRTRRITEHLFQAQDLECVETLISIWHNFMLEDDQIGCSKVLGLISTVDTARPKVTLPAILNALYSRTHPSALEPDRRSSLTSELSEVAVVEFLNTYIRSLEDDAMDEIWQNCITFLKDVLTSPLNHRQVLVQLLEFVVEIGAKIDKTNFGEQRKMRRELGDIFIRLVSAITTIKPTNTMQDKPPVKKEQAGKPGAFDGKYATVIATGTADLVMTLSKVFPRLSLTLLEHDRLGSVSSQVSTQILAPILKSRTFPDNIDQHTLDLLKTVGMIPEAQRIYKRDVADAFNDPKFFSNDIDLLDTWIPIIRQWVIGDKEKLPDLCSRLTAPTAAGLMFGVGANSARLEADRRTQLTLRRIAVILLAGPMDAFVVNLPILLEKLVELLNADTTSSPSAVTRAELYMVFRALLLRMSPTHLNSLWPILNSEIQDVLTSTFINDEHESLSNDSLLQLCKLIDTLLLLNFDDFQLQEWLIITDTTDAVNREAGQNVALIDLLAAEISDGHDNSVFSSNIMVPRDTRKPLLTHEMTAKVTKRDYRDRLIKPFFRNLSIMSFESIYNLDARDEKACEKELGMDIFNDSTLV